MQKYKITKVFVNDKSKDGVEFKSKKTGKKFWKIAIQTEETGTEYYSNFFFDESSPMAKLKDAVGKVVEMELYEKDGYKNFKLPEPIDSLEKRVQALEQALKKYVDMNITSEGKPVPFQNDPLEAPKDGFEDTPF